MGFTLFTGLEFVLYFIFQGLKFKDKKEEKRAAGLMFFFMFLFAAIRGSGDGDYYNYLRFAYDIGRDFSKVLNFSYPVEFSFRLLAYIINVLGLSRQWVIALMNFFSIFPTARVVTRESKDPFLSSIIFLPIFIQFDMQTSRTATAIGLSTMAVYKYSQGERWKGLLYFIWALSFHRSAIIVLPFLILMNIRMGNFFKFVTVLLAFGISLFSGRLLAGLSRLLAGVGLSSFSGKITYYTFSGRFAKQMAIYDPRIIFGFLLFLTTIFYYEKDSFQKRTLEDATNKAIRFGLVVLLVFRSSTAIAFRFSNFFVIFETLYIPRLLEDLKERDRLGRLFVILAVLIYIIPYSIYLMADSPPYNFFFTSPTATNSLSLEVK